MLRVHAGSVEHNCTLTDALSPAKTVYQVQSFIKKHLDKDAYNIRTYSTNGRGTRKLLRNRINYPI